MEAWMQRGASATPPRRACSPLGRQPPRRSRAGATVRREKRPSPGLRQGRLPRAVTWPRGAMRSRGTRCVEARDEARTARRACAPFRYAAMTIDSSNPVREQVLRRGSFFPSKRSGPVSTSVFEPRSEASLMLSFRPAGPEDARETSTLVRTSFRVVASRDWAPEAVARFLHETSEEEVRRRLQTATFSMLATAGATACGFILMPIPSTIGMLFVHPSWLRRGIGRALVSASRMHVESMHRDVSAIELNSSPYALPFYRTLGFVAISLPFEFCGAKATRMACWLRRD